MSKGNSPIKVLRTALKRVQKGWTRNSWHFHNPVDGVNYVCLEGALFGYCDEGKHELTDAQKKAREIVLSVVKDRYPSYRSIPEFNDDAMRTKEEVMEVLKLSIIRVETGGDEDEIGEEDFENLLEFMDSK